MTAESTVPHASPPAPSGAAPRVRIARGVTVITAAKLWFVAAGYALYFGLTRALGPADFGLYAVVTSIVSVLNNVVIAATLQTVSRFTARDEGRAGSVLRAGLLVQTAIGLGLFLLLQVLAGAIAGFLRDPRIEVPLRVAAAIVPAYALYAVNVGFLNGRRQFGRQAMLDITYSTLRLGLTVGAVLLGLGVVGAVAGFAAAALLILGVSALLIAREPRPHAPFSMREFLHFGGWLVVLTLLANLLLTADLWIVKRLADPVIANQRAGVFRAALTLSQLLYQMLIPIALVLFPTLAKLAASEDPGTARAIVHDALRYVVMAVLPGAALIGGMGGELLGLLYGAAYRAGGEWLVFLAPAYAGWTLAYLLAVALAGAGAARSGVIVLAIGLVAQVAAGSLLHGALGPRGVAIGDVIGSAAAVLAGLAFATRRFGAILPWRSLGHGAVLAAAFFAVARGVPTPAWGVPFKVVGCAVAGLAFLHLRGELKVPVRAAAAQAGR